MASFIQRQIQRSERENLLRAGWVIQEEPDEHAEIAFLLYAPGHDAVAAAAPIMALWRFCINRRQLDMDLSELTAAVRRLPR